MTTFKADVEVIIRKLSLNLPRTVLEKMFDEYIIIKHKFTLGEHRPSELSGGHFAEAMLRLFEHMLNWPLTPFGTTANREKIVKAIENDVTQPESFRKIASKLIPILMDVRNTRGVAHTGGIVNANYSDSTFVVHCADWMVTEIIRHYYSCSIDEANKLVTNINTAKIPVIFDVNGQIRILNTDLTYKEKTLLILYYKNHEFVSERDLISWLKHPRLSAYKTNVINKLNSEELIIYQDNSLLLTPKGIKTVEKNIPLDIEVV